MVLRTLHLRAQTAFGCRNCKRVNLLERKVHYDYVESVLSYSQSKDIVHVPAVGALKVGELNDRRPFLVYPILGSQPIKDAVDTHSRFA